MNGNLSTPDGTHYSYAWFLDDGTIPIWTTYPDTLIRIGYHNYGERSLTLKTYDIAHNFLGEVTKTYLVSNEGLPEPSSEMVFDWVEPSFSAVLKAQAAPIGQSVNRTLIHARDSVIPPGLGPSDVLYEFWWEWPNEQKKARGTSPNRHIGYEDAGDYTIRLVITARLAGGTEQREAFLDIKVPVT